nr:MAG TPA: tail tape measure [Caudoviricetes sp.]
MGKKHLSEDKIQYMVSADSSEAQKEIHDLIKVTKELKKEEKERRTAMIELEAQGKKNTKEYRNLEKETKSLSKQITDNNKKIGTLTRSLDINAMTGRQLKKVAKELTATLEDMSEAADPEEYAKLSRRLGDVRKRMAELKNSGNNVKQEFDLTKTAVSKLKAAVAAFILVKLAGYLKEIIANVYSTRKEFAKYEAVLRNTLQSQEKAAAAMKMLQRLAADTPGSLQEWTEAYIKLVNRGIKPTTAELTNIGDLAASQGKSVDQLIEAILDAMTGENERLKEFGIKASKNGNTVKYTFRGVTTEVQNTEEAIKSYLLSLGKLDGISGSMATQMKELEGMESNFKDTLDNLWNKMGKRVEGFFKKGLSWATDFVSDITKVMEPLSDTFEDQMEKVVNLERQLPGMATRYDELAGKVNRNAEEQKELNSLIERISNIVPSAVSEWDQYGNVISLNTQKVYDYLSAEKARLNFVHREEIKSLRAKKEEAKAEMESLMLQNKRGKVWAGGTGYGNTKDQGMRDMTDAEIAANVERIAELKEELDGVTAQLDKISGDGIDKIVKKRIKAQDDATEAQTRFNNMNKSMLSAWLKDEKNAADQYREIAQEIYDKRFPTTPIEKDKSDPNAVALKNQESNHEAEINQIRLVGREKQQAEEDINQAILKSDLDYYNKRIKLLEQFKTNATKAAKKSEYQKQIVDAKSKLIDTEEAMEKQKISAVDKLRQEDLEKEKAVTSAQRMFLTNELAAKHITQEQFAMLTLSLDSTSAETRLAIEQRYLNDVNDLELKNGKLKSDAVKQVNAAVLSADQDAANARAAIQTKMNDLTKDFKSQFKLTTVGEDLQAQMKVLDATYQARKQLAEKEKLDTQELDIAYLKAKEQLVQDSENRINQIRNQYGLLNQQQQYDLQLQQLKTHLENETLTQEEYEQSVQNLKRDSYKKQFDYYSDLFSGAVQALQQAEMDNVDAQYDAEIEAAQGNTEEVERLEKEKAQKKLDIQKKYADVNFAIKVSQIIADTAVSIMRAFADLGPIAGAVAAALMGVTGAAQIASANAERNKIKNMTLAGTSSSSKGSGQRVATGREDGGKIDVRRAQDGKLFAGADYDPDARGFIDKPTVIVGEGPAGQSKEWVASNAAVENPTVGPILDMIDKSQQAGTIRTLDLNQAVRSKMAGFSSGGSISQPLPVTGTPKNDGSGAALPPELMEKFAHAIIDMNKNGVNASVALSEFEKKQELRDRSRQIGSKG